MKFGKEFVSQMVPEWRETYMDYNHLKSLLKDIQQFKLNTEPSSPNPNGPDRSTTLYRAFSGLTESYDNFKRHHRGGDIEDQVILITDESEDEIHGYRTTFLMSSDQGGEFEQEFFNKLDDELNKIVKFYKKMVGEMMKEDSMLNKQMDALIAFKIKIENPDASIDWSRTTEVETMGSSSDADDDSTNISRRVAQDGREGFNDIREKYDDALTEDSPNRNESILDSVKFTKIRETPLSTIKHILNINRRDELVFDRQNLRRVERILQLAFIEFYQKLRLLKNYSFYNILAFAKIMKKYDKITSRNASKSYLNMVNKSYLGSSDEVNKLMEMLEPTFIKHFANGNRSKGITILRPKAKRERHRVTFSLGFFSGCTTALLVALILIIYSRHIIGKPGSTEYMETMFPQYSFFGYIVLHLFMFAGNIYYWRRYRINYSFIFCFKQGTHLGYREVLLFSTGLAALALATVLGS